MVLRCRATDGRAYSLREFVAWYGLERGFQEWAEAEEVTGAEEPGFERVGGASNELLATVTEPGTSDVGADARAFHGRAEENIAQAATSGAGAAELGVQVPLTVLVDLEQRMSDVQAALPRMAPPLPPPLPPTRVS